MQSKVRIEGSRALSGNVLSLADRISQRAKKVQVTHVKGWPLCGSCVRTRATWFSLTLVMFFGGLVAFTGSLLIGVLTEGPTGQVFAGVAMIGFVVMVLSAFPFHYASYSRLTGASTTQDGTGVVVANASRAFAAEVSNEP